MVLYLCNNFFSEEGTYCVGSYGEEFTVYSYTYTLLALTHAEGASKLYLISEIVFSNQALELFYYLARTFDVTGASDTNCDFKHDIIPLVLHYISVGAVCFPTIVHCFL